MSFPEFRSSPRAGLIAALAALVWVSPAAAQKVGGAPTVPVAAAGPMASLPVANVAPYFDAGSRTGYGVHVRPESALVRLVSISDNEIRYFADRLGMLPAAVHIEATTILEHCARQTAGQTALVVGRRPDARSHITVYVENGTLTLFNVRSGGVSSIVQNVPIPNWNHARNAPNRIAVDVQGQSVGVTINGAYLGAWNAPEPVEGLFGIGATGWCQNVYRDISISPLGAAAVAQPVAAGAAMTAAGVTLPALIAPYFTPTTNANFSLALDASGAVRLTNFGEYLSGTYADRLGVVPANVRIEAIVSSPFCADRSAALIFGWDGNTRFRVVLFGDGGVNIVRNEPAAHRNTLLNGATINLGSVWSNPNARILLSVDVRGQSITPYVNGVPVPGAPFFAERQLTGLIGLSGAAGGCTTVFENLRVSPL